MPRKLSYEYVKEQIEKKGYELLSGSYINSKTKLKLRCDKGHDFEMNFDCYRRTGLDR